MCSRGCTCGCSPDHMRLQPRSHAVAAPITCGCRHAAGRRVPRVPRARRAVGQLRARDPLAHAHPRWRDGRRYPRPPPVHPPPRPTARTRCALYFLYLVTLQPTLPAYFAYLLTLPTYLLHLLTYSTSPPTHLLHLLTPPTCVPACARACTYSLALLTLPTLLTLPELPLTLILTLSLSLTLP